VGRPGVARRACASGDRGLDLAGAVIGALVCSRLSERRGRRMTLLIVAEVFVVGASCPPGQFRPADFARGQ
jgi:hypothetical protein